MVMILTREQRASTRVLTPGQPRRRPEPQVAPCEHDGCERDHLDARQALASPDR
jgi:hypothetical protein